MIGRLTGILLEKQPPHLLLDVQGVGYELEAPMSTFYQLPAAGERVVLHTHLVVREDAQLLFGFYTDAERSMFRSLIRVNGVGPKLALTILSGVSADEFTRCILEDDAKALTGLPGVGKKTAERLIVEMRDKIDADATLPAAMAPSGVSAAATNPVGDAVSALVALGYKAQEASRMVRQIDTRDMQTEDIIKLALQGTVTS